MELDVNFDIYPIDKNGEYRVLIVRSLGISRVNINPNTKTLHLRLIISNMLCMEEFSRF